MIKAIQPKGLLISVFLVLSGSFTVLENVNRETVLVLHSADRDDAFARRVDVGLHRALGQK